jgi:glycosyltransferase involved in cell wall biosynthesis
MLTPCYYPAKGGTETIVRNLAILLNRNGVHTDVATFNMEKKWNPKWSGQTERIDGLTVFRIPGLNWLPMTHSPRIAHGVNLIPGRFTNLFKDYDILHFHEAEYGFLLFSLFSKKPKILHLHGILNDFLKKNPSHILILKHIVDYYIAITKQIKNDLVDLGIPQERIVYLPNGIDPKFFCPKKEKEHNLLLFVGRITSSKGLHVLFDSLRYLEEPIHLVIIGPAQFDLNYYQNVFKRNMERINLEGKHRITYLGPLNQADIVKWYQKASIFVLPSFAEGLPVAVLEALSCGTPVVSTTVGGIPEVVRDYENGILVPPNNSLKLGEAIRYLLDNEPLRIKMGLEGRKYVKANFSLEVIVKKLCSIYQNICA